MGLMIQTKTKPELGYYNTDIPGRRNTGHKGEENLNPEEMNHVLEFLKTL